MNEIVTPLVTPVSKSPAKWLIALIVISVILVLTALVTGIAFAVIAKNKANEVTDEVTDEPMHTTEPPYIEYSPEPILALENQPINISFSQLIGPNKNFKPLLSNII